MKIEGVIEDIVFRNSENGYTVALLSHGNTLDTIVGKMLDVKIGQSVELDGNFVENTRYGNQFAFSSCTITEPKTEEAIEKYLSSGLIPGVGEITAHRIVEAFGINSLSVMELSPENLSKIRGISKEKAIKISAGYTEIKKLERVVMFLQKYEITTNMSLKIYEVYGEKTISLLEQNPYRLVEDVDGIGFMSADRIARNMGISTDSEFRIRAGCIYVLSELCEKNGHTYLPRVILENETKKILSLSDEIDDLLSKVICELVFDKYLISINVNGQEVLTLQKYYNMENALAKKISFLLYAKDNTDFDLNADIDDFEIRNKISFHESQRNAIITAINNNISIITGGPGTGKTTIVRCIIEILKAQNKSVLLCAPTGRAAKRLEESTGEVGKTIHRALEVKVNKHGVTFSHNENNPLPFDVVIIDEFSMVDVPLAYGLFKAISKNSKVIIVGDKDQLPSVGVGNVLHDIIESEKVPVSVLSKIFRQDENSIIVSNAHLINEGKMPELSNSSADFFYENKGDLNDILDTVVKLTSQRLPKFCDTSPSKVQVLACLKAGVCGTNNINKQLQEKINPFSYSKNEIQCGETIFREGDKVMQTINNYELKWVKTQNDVSEEGEGVFNGDIGTILSINKGTSECLVFFEDGKVATYSKVELPELTLSYAITVHKSQGCEFDVVVLPVIAGSPTILTKNLLYTGVTRAKKLVVLVGEKKNISRMVRSIYLARRYTHLKSLIISECKRIEDIYE